jgi:CubicO group peptidase (beta-lactamase class C family)
MSDRRTVGAHRVGRSVISAVLTAAAITTTACGSTPSTTSSTTPMPVPTTGAAASPQVVAALTASLDEVVDRTLVPGAIVLVRSGRFGDATFTFGNTERGGTQPVATNDHVRVGSVTKTMTATVVLQLVQEGRLALDDPVGKFVPNVPGGDDITIAQLLDMHSGLSDYTNDAAWVRAASADPQRVWTAQELLDVALAHPLEFVPGSNWRYSNTNYIVLGMITEQVTGEAASDLFEQRLFEPLGMGDTSLPSRDDASIPVPFLHGYHYGSFDHALLYEQQQQAAAGTLLPVDASEFNPSYGWTAGAAISTPDDLVVWVDALVQGTLLSPATQRLRMDSIHGVGPASPEAEGAFGYGYGIYRTGSYYGHDGQAAGYTTVVARDPDTDTTIVVVADLTLAPDGTLVASALADAVMSALADGRTAPSTLVAPPDDLPPNG